ncbi:hypothetical protein [Microseira sp. BLCC-F43]
MVHLRVPAALMLLAQEAKMLYQDEASNPLYYPMSRYVENGM